jgi:hypothetical protein
MAKKKESVEEKILKIANGELDLYSTERLEPSERLVLLRSNARENLKVSLCNVLDGLIKDKQLKESDDLQFFLSNQESTRPFYIVENGVLKEFKGRLAFPIASFFQSFVESMTLRYAHLAPSHKVKAVNILDDSLTSSSTSQLLHKKEGAANE